ncbi:MAG: phosphoserine aminotransferase, partial [Rhodobacteraceae bacterium]
GETINTPSMLAVADYDDALAWGEGIGGLPALMGRADANFAALQGWVDRTPWVENLVAEPAHRSNTSVCLRLVDPAVAALDDAGQRAFVKAMVSALEREAVAFDIGGYRDAPPGLRIWCGATVDAADIAALTPWLDWAFETVKAQRAAA